MRVNFKLKGLMSRSFQASLTLIYPLYYCSSNLFTVHHGIYFHSVLPPTNAEPVRDPPAKVEPEPLICLAFEFDDSIIYMSDVSGIPQRTWDRMLQPSSRRQSIFPTPIDSRGEMTLLEESLRISPSVISPISPSLPAPPVVLSDSELMYQC